MIFNIKGVALPRDVPRVFFQKSFEEAIYLPWLSQLWEICINSISRVLEIYLIKFLGIIKKHWKHANNIIG